MPPAVAAQPIIVPGATGATGNTNFTNIKNERAVASTQVQRVPARGAYMPYGDAARVLGTLAVVLCHTADIVLFAPDVPAGDWWIANLTDSATRWAVPIYIMLSGALLLDPARREPAAVFYRKRLLRLGAPILFWTVFYIWFAVRVTGWMGSSEIATRVLQGKPYEHLHFIYRIAGLYAFTPVLREFLAHANARTVKLAALLLLGFSAGNSVVDGIFGTELSLFARFVPFLGYFLLGYVLRERVLTRNEWFGCWMLAVSCVLLLAGGTGELAAHYGVKPYPSVGFMLYDFLSPVRITLAVCVWLILVNTFNAQWLQSRPGQFVSRVIAPATLGIYLIHMLFRDLYLDYCFDRGLAPFGSVIPLGIFAVAAAVYACSLVSVLVLMRIPFVRRVVS
jgi:surface polysaccharide O-acyltransferase-like enzyme